MSKKYYLGVDIGTYESKGVLIDQDYNLIANKAVRHDLENPQPNHYEHDAEKVWWGDLCQITRGLIAESGIDPAQIACVGSSALGADCVPVDENCRPLRKAILYGIDSRAVGEMEYMNGYYGEEKINALWGRPLCSSDVAPKILWIKNNEPEVYQRAHKFLTATSYLTAKLTGKYVIDKFLINTFTPCYKPDGSVDEEHCQLYCRPDQLAECRETLDIVGTVTAQAAAETGLAEGTPVLTGTDDAGAEAISTGIFVPGDMMVMLGSSCYLIYCSDRLVIDPRLWHDTFILPGAYSITGGTNNAGTLTRWFRDNIFFDKLAQQEEGGRNAYESILDELEDIPAGSDGLITLPYFAGERTPINDPHARGVLFGLTLQHTRAHMYKSALEGVAYSIAQHLDIISEHQQPLTKIMAVGGGSKNKLWLQIIADVTGHDIQTAKITIGASFGDALMAAVAAGNSESFADLDEKIAPAEVYKPNPENRAVYARHRKVFDELYQRTKDLMREL